MNLTDEMKETGIVPVVVLERVEDAVPTAKALLAGGVNFMEITLRTNAAIDAIKAVAKECPDMHVGAGTVLNLEQCKTAIDAGATFIVSPGFSEEIVRYCLSKDLPVVPGCVTPTEIMGALEMGLHILKFFPANIYGGIKAMKALAAPFGMISFIPTGGVNGENIDEYITQPFVHAVGGSWICTKSDISEGNFSKIEQLCKEAKEKIKNRRD